MGPAERSLARSKTEDAMTGRPTLASNWGLGDGPLGDNAFAAPVLIRRMPLRTASTHRVRSLMRLKSNSPEVRLIMAFPGELMSSTSFLHRSATSLLCGEAYVGLTYHFSNVI